MFPFVISNGEKRVVGCVQDGHFQHLKNWNTHERSHLLPKHVTYILATQKTFITINYMHSAQAVQIGAGKFAIYCRRGRWVHL